MPAGCVGITIGIDTGKRLLHWTAIAWTAAGGGYVIEYGNQTVLSDKLGVRAGLVAALGTLKGYFDRGWQGHVPAQVWIDSGYHEHLDGVMEFCQAAAVGMRRGSEVYRPSKGYGDGQRTLGRYWQPKKVTSEIIHIGEGYHLSWVPKWRVAVANVDANHWKSQLHHRLTLPPDAPTAIVLFEAADMAEHTEFGEHLTAERQVEKWVDGKGESVTWERIRRANHYLDSSYSACAAGSLLLDKVSKPRRPSRSLGEIMREGQRKG